MKNNDFNQSILKTYQGLKNWSMEKNPHEYVSTLFSEISSLSEQTNIFEKLIQIFYIEYNYMEKMLDKTEHALYFIEHADDYKKYFNLEEKHILIESTSSIAKINKNEMLSINNYKQQIQKEIDQLNLKYAFEDFDLWIEDYSVLDDHSQKSHSLDKLIQQKESFEKSYTDLHKFISLAENIDDNFKHFLEDFTVSPARTEFIKEPCLSEYEL